MGRYKRVFEENKKLAKVIEVALDQIDIIVNEVWESADASNDSKPTPYECGMYQACRRINRAMQEALESEEK